MPAFEKPRFAFDWDVDSELKALRGYSSQPGKEDRAIPPKAAGRILLATWNIANFGLQERRPDDHRLIAEILGWFDFVAIQEVHDNLAGLRAVQDLLPKKYRVLFNDAGGNQERFAFLFDSTKFKSLEVGISNRLDISEGTTLHYLSHNGPDSPNPPEYDPAMVFQRLFGTGFTPPYSYTAEATATLAAAIQSGAGPH